MTTQDTATDTTTATLDAPDENHMSSVRRMLVDQMRALRAASTADALLMETARAKSVALVAQAITGAARVEVDYAASSGSNSTVPFLEQQPAGIITHGTPPNITHSPGRMVHRIRG